MPLNEFYGGALFRRLARHCPRIAMGLAGAAATLDSAMIRHGFPGDMLWKNISHAFPDASKSEISAIIRKNKVSGYRAATLYAYLARANKRQLLVHAINDVSYTNSSNVELIKNCSGPVILVTPHYGAFLSASLRLLHDIGPHKRFNFFFDHPDENPQNVEYPEMYRRTEDANATVLLNGRRSVISAIRVLQENQILTMMPDVYRVGGNNISVPFFGRLANAMTGTAFFALKSKALLIPVYTHTKSGMKCEVDIQEPIPLSNSSSFDQALYETTAALFSNIEVQLMRAPEHWAYWADLHRRFSCASKIPSPHAIGEDWKGCLHELLAELRIGAPPVSPIVDKIERLLN